MQGRNDVQQALARVRQAARRDKDMRFTAFLRHVYHPALKERFAKFGLELHPDKTRLMEFGTWARKNRARSGEGKPETFTGSPPTTRR
jgi:hypothetical protein